MYLEHFQLSQNPFQINSDPAFLWYGEKHKEALATLKYGFYQDKSFLLLTGDIGLGKTSIINALLKLLGKNDLAVSITDPKLEKLDFFNFIAAAFGMPETYSAKGAFLRDFKSFLLKCRNEGKKVLLIIDESQRLTPDLLEEIRLLADIESDGSKLMKVFFVGQTEFNDILMRPENKAIRQRITINYNIDPLNLKETAKYLVFRLMKAGAKKNFFNKDAVEAIYIFSKGYPRLINIIADRAMLTAFVQSKKRITKDIVRECAAELDISKAKVSHDNDVAAFKSDHGSGIQEIVHILEPIDSKKFRAALDDQGLSRTSMFRMVLTRIHRAASDPQELQSTIKEEANRISSSVSRNELKAMMATNAVPFLKPIIQTLHELVFEKSPENMA